MDTQISLPPDDATSHRDWTREALKLLRQEAARSADTHLLRLAFEGFPGIEFYFKDEAAHPTGSLKHRLARSLYLYALCNGRLRPGQPVVDASSGSTAISEAWFARLLGLPFTAVMPAATAPRKIADVQALGGHCDLVDDPSQVYERAAWHAANGACHLDQFGLAVTATDWRGNNNIAESIFHQMAMEPHPVPEWVVVGAGTGGTSATIGRYVRYRGHATQVCVVDPEGSAFLPGFCGELEGYEPCGSRIEGIGRPRVEPSFIPGIVDRMCGVPDAASVAAMRFLGERTGLSCGPSTGTALYAVLRLACEMRAEGRAGSIVTLLCDDGSRYADTYCCDDWVADRGWGLDTYLRVLERAWETGVWDESRS